MRLQWKILPVVAMGILAGCGDGEGTPQQQLVARGEYLVEHVAACGDCHTPRTMNGELDRSRWLAGTPLFADIVPGNDMQGAIGTPNLTPDSTGLLLWTDVQIKSALLDGIDDEGGPLFPIMPYWVYHNMDDSDADAIVAYLRSVPRVRNAIPERQPLPFPFTQPAQPIPESRIPHTTLPSSDSRRDNAERGRYLAALAGVCIDCHSPEAMGPVPIDVDNLFAGGREFEPGVFASNITPHATGIRGWTAADVRTLLRFGIDVEGRRLCGPMPVGPDGAFGGLTTQDALDIGWYITTLPPIANAVTDCTP